MKKQDKILLDGLEFIKKEFADDFNLQNIKKLNQTRKIYYKFQNRIYSKISKTIKPSKNFELQIFSIIKKLDLIFILLKK